MSLSVERAVTGSSRLAPALIAAIAVAIGCRRPYEPSAPPEREDPIAERHTAPTSDPGAPERPRFDRPAMVRFHMQRHFDDLRTIERQLIAGKLDEARALAHLLARPAPDPGIAPWQSESRRVVDAALALASAPTLDEACRREPRVSAACAGCHRAVQAGPMFRPPPSLPPDLMTPDARMVRHLWATDRLWEAMVSGTEPAWRGGLEVLAATPLPFAPDGTSRFANRLGDLARDQLLRTATLDERAAAYGELLMTCTGCHTRFAPAAK